MYIFFFYLYIFFLFVFKENPISFVLLIKWESLTDQPSEQTNKSC